MDKTKKLLTWLAIRRVMYALIAFVLLALIAKCTLGNASSNIVRLGETSVSLAKIDYRMIDEHDSDGKLIKKNQLDALQLTMDAQSGSAFDKWVLIGVRSCYGPRIEEIHLNRHTNYYRRLPTVQCESWGGETIKITSNDKVRQFLMRIEGDKKFAKVTGRVAGVSGASTLTIAVTDSTLKVD